MVIRSLLTAAASATTISATRAVTARTTTFTVGGFSQLTQSSKSDSNTCIGKGLETRPWARRQFSTCNQRFNDYSKQSTPLGVTLSSEEFQTARRNGLAYLKEHGYDLDSAYEQAVVWGDHDRNDHVNNVRYLRWIETQRMHFFERMVANFDKQRRLEVLGGGGGIGVILASTFIKYKRPAFYPDTLLIASKPNDLKKDRFNLDAVLWSYAQQKVVSTVEALIVTYDYDKHSKAPIPDDLLKALKEKM